MALRVGIAGAGAIACGNAAVLIQAGHDVALWSPSGARTGGLADGQSLVISGAIEGKFDPSVAPSAAELVRGRDVIIVALPANGHKAVLDALAPNIGPSQTVIISSHASFGALYLARLLAARGVIVPIVAWGTTATTCRASAHDSTNVTVTSVRARIDMCTLPERLMPEGKRVCEALFGANKFVEREGLLAITLSNVNPQNHLGIALCNLTRMERGEAWSQGENVTPYGSFPPSIGFPHSLPLPCSRAAPSAAPSKGSYLAAASGAAIGRARAAAPLRRPLLPPRPTSSFPPDRSRSQVRRPAAREA